MSSADSLERPSAPRAVVLALSAFGAVSAISGGGYLLANAQGGPGAPLALLGATPFTTFVVPGLLLAGVVGGALATCFVLALRRAAFALDALVLAGGALTLWIACEAAILREHSWLQLVYGGIGAILLGIGAALSWRSTQARHRWVVRVTLGEAAGFLVPSVVGVMAMTAGTSSTARAALLVLAGAVEGLACGAGQAWAFPLPIRRARFAAWTALGAATVWALAMMLVAAAHHGVSGTSIAIAALALAPIALAAMGLAQWLELRHHTTRARGWIAWTALAWLVALPASFAPMPFVDETTSIGVNVVLWSSAGLCMAYLMALVTWQGAARMARAT